MRPTSKIAPAFPTLVVLIVSTASCGDEQTVAESDAVEGNCADACGGACTEDNPSYDSRDHVEQPVDHGDTPPAGGDHDRCWAEWGVHQTAVPAHNWVHNLEHGGIVLLYNCADGCDDDVTALAEVADSTDGLSWLMTPYGDMDSRFAVVAWERRMLLDCVDEAAISGFIADHADNAPESVASGPPTGCM